MGQLSGPNKREPMASAGVCIYLSIYLSISLSLSLSPSCLAYFGKRHSGQLPKFETNAGAQQLKWVLRCFSLCFWNGSILRPCETGRIWVPSLLQAILWKPLKFLLTSSQHPPSGWVASVVFSRFQSFQRIASYPIGIELSHQGPTVWFYAYALLPSSAPNLESQYLGQEPQFAQKSE